MFNTIEVLSILPALSSHSPDRTLSAATVDRTYLATASWRIKVGSFLIKTEDHSRSTELTVVTNRRGLPNSFIDSSVNWDRNGTWYQGACL